MAAGAALTAVEVGTVAVVVAGLVAEVEAEAAVKDIKQPIRLRK